MRGGNTLFKPGQSGNPTGRPKQVLELLALAQTNFPLALERLRKLIESPDDDMAFRAIQFVFAYAVGKPSELKDLMHNDTMRARMTQLVAVKVEDEVPAAPPPMPLPEVVPETREAQSPSPTEAMPQAPLEALDEVTPVQEPSGLPEPKPEGSVAFTAARTDNARRRRWLAPSGVLRTGRNSLAW